MDPAQQRLAERRMVAALRRLHRREPMRADFRADAVLRELRADAGERLPAGHRGGGSLQDVTDVELMGIVEGIVAAGKVLRNGHRLRLPSHAPILLDAEMRGRVERLMAGLSGGGTAPPRVQTVAGRLGIPPGVIAQLRAAGELVAMGDGVDYPRAVAGELQARLDEMARGGPLTVSQVRSSLGTTRRHAEALLAYRRGRRDQRRVERHAPH